MMVPTVESGRMEKMVGLSSDRWWYSLPKKKERKEEEEEEEEEEDGGMKMEE